MLARTPLAPLIRIVKYDHVVDDDWVSLETVR
jgi:hypothetical protein